MKKAAALFDFLLYLCTNILQAQDDMMAMLEGDQKKEKEFVNATFKDTRIINLHSLETVGKRTLQYRISHRFGDLNSGAYQFWGLDGGASMRMGLEYSYDGRFSVGLGRTNVEKVVDGFAKYRILRQTTDGKMPISMSWVSSMFVTTLKNDPPVNHYKIWTNRLAYSHQLIIGRKFSERLSLQLAPTMVHFNLVDSVAFSHDNFSIAVAGRFKLTRRLAITGEYTYRLNDFSPNTQYYNSAGIGLDIETGGHVFQFMFVNSFGMVETQFIPRTTTTWQNAGVRLGFNISRVFTL